MSSACEAYYVLVPLERIVECSAGSLAYLIRLLSDVRDDISDDTSWHTLRPTGRDEVDPPSQRPPLNLDRLGAKFSRNDDDALVPVGSGGCQLPSPRDTWTTGWLLRVTVPWMTARMNCPRGI